MSEDRKVVKVALKDLPPKKQEEILLTRRESLNNVLCIAYGKKESHAELVESFPSDWHSKDYLLSKMFPKDLGPNGDSFVFFFNRHEFDENSKILCFQCAVYQVNSETEEWNQIVGEHDSTRITVEMVPFNKRFRVKKDHPMARIVIKETWNNNVIIDFDIDGNHGMTLLSDNYHETGEYFCSIYDSESQNFGFVCDEDVYQEFRRRVDNLTAENKEWKKLNRQTVQERLKGERKHFYVCLGLSMSHNFGDQSLVLVTKKHLYHSLYPILKHTMEQIVSPTAFWEGGIKEVLKELYLKLNINIRIPLGYRKMKDYQKKVLRWSICDQEKVTYTTHFDVLNRHFQLKFNLGLFGSEVGDEKCSVAKLLTKFKADLMIIYNAILQEKKLIFYSKKQSISEIARVLFSVILMVCPPLTGIMEYRVFPYCTMEDLDEFSHVVGYIVGVNDPSFKDKAELWDVFCNIDTGAVRKNPESYPKDSKKPFEDLDRHFVNILVDMTYSHVLKRLKIEYTDHCLRSHFYMYTQDLINMAIGVRKKSKDLMIDESMAFINNAIEKNFSRFQEWKKTYSYSFYLNKFEEERTKSSIFSDENFNQMQTCVTLLKSGNLKEEVITDMILHTFNNILKLREQLVEFLSYFPLVQGGLYCIAILLFHKSEKVRFGVCKFLRRLEKLKEGYSCVGQLNMFLQIQYDAVTRKMKRLQKLKEKEAAEAWKKAEEDLESF